MWIVCAGGKRSGSTLQYNIISKIIEESNKGKRLTHFKPDEFSRIKNENIKFDGYKVIKSHFLTKEIKFEINNGNALVFHSFRDVRDVVVSSINKGWINNKEVEIKNCVTNYLREYNDWVSLPNKIYSRKYENFAFHIIKEINYYLKVLKINLCNDKIKAISEGLNIKSLKKNQDKIDSKKVRNSFKQTFHEDTLLHTNHINDGSSNQFLKVLSKLDITIIESISYVYLLKHNYKFYWAGFDNFISFSQHADDYIAWQLIKKQRIGTVVEVGAFDGIHLSNSYSLEQLGWNSICIEPNPEIYNYLIKNRPNAININKAIVGSDKIKEIDFYTEEIGVLSGCNYNEEDIKLRYKNRGIDYKDPKKIKVKTSTLNSILKNIEIKNNVIDLISIDVEGFELEVLKGLNLETYTVKLFVIEANNLNEKTRILDFFKKYKSYIHIGDNIQNMFILNKEYFSKKIIRNLNFNNYVKAKQMHPKDNVLTIDSTSPKFVKTKDIKKYEKYFGIFYRI